MIVYLLTLLVSGGMAARAILLTPADCEQLGRRIAENDPLYASKPYKVQCDPMPLYVGTKGTPKEEGK